MDYIHYKLLNLGYIFAKFFLLLFWVYLTWVILSGGEIKIMIGENGVKLGFEGIIPSVKRLFSLLGGK